MQGETGYVLVFCFVRKVHSCILFSKEDFCVSHSAFQIVYLWMEVGSSCRTTSQWSDSETTATALTPAPVFLKWQCGVPSPRLVAQNNPILNHTLGRGKETRSSMMSTQYPSPTYSAWYTCFGGRLNGVQYRKNRLGESLPMDIHAPQNTDAHRGNFTRIRAQQF